MRDGKVIQLIPAESGWSAVLPADGVDRVRLAPVACWALVEGATGAREVVPLLGGPTRALVAPGDDTLGIAAPGEGAEDWSERLSSATSAARPSPAPPPSSPADPRSDPPAARSDIPGADVLDD